MFDILLARAAHDAPSVGDLLAFDQLMATLTEAQQTLVARKIAHEVSDGEPARRVAQLEDEVDATEREAEANAEDARTLRHKVDQLTPIAQRAQAATEACVQMEENIIALRNENANLVIRHEHELREAEMIGYRRGIAEVAA